MWENRNLYEIALYDNLHKHTYEAVLPDQKTSSTWYIYWLKISIGLLQWKWALFVIVNNLQDRNNINIASEILEKISNYRDEPLICYQ